MKNIVRHLWNRLTSRKRGLLREQLDLGWMVADGEISRKHLVISSTRRKEHLALLGKTGTGKSSLMRWLCAQDIAAGRGFVYFDLHGDATPFLLRRVALEEKKRQCDLSNRLIVIDPADVERSVGMNILERGQEDSAFVQIAEFTELLRHRWHLETLGPRTDELLRNSLYVLCENNLTLLEVEPLLTNFAFRNSCLREVRNGEVRRYFEVRYNKLSEGMRRLASEPILNKVSGFTADPHFRHIVGQQESTFSWREAMETSAWVVINLDKGRLGEEAVTLGSLFLSMIKNSFFSRHNRELVTLYCDEVQNLVSYDSGLDTILAESRKFGISMVTANQFLEQYSPRMRAAILAVGTQILFQLTSSDAQQMAAALDGGKPLAEQLKNLPHRHAIVKTGTEHWQELRVPRIDDPKVAYMDLLTRSQERWAPRRSEIEAEILGRHAISIDDWK